MSKIYDHRSNIGYFLNVPCEKTTDKNHFNLKIIDKYLPSVTPVMRISRINTDLCLISNHGFPLNIVKNNYIIALQISFVCVSCSDL